jgi:hypothetical protein
VRLGDRAVPEAGELIAMWLEHGGMPNIDWTTQAFSRSSEATFPQITAAFGDYVRRNSITTEYALYAEVFFTPGVGVSEIRGVMVDKIGTPVWSYRQTPEDAEFKKEQPKEPMECMAMLVNALREPLHLENPFREGGFEGRVTKRWSDRTGLPISSERAAMQTALMTARANLARSKLVVFPVLKSGQPDRKQATHLAQMLNEANLGKAEVTAAEPAVKISTGPNEQQRLWQVARAFREHLRQSPATADYAVFADYTFAPDGKAFTVHFFVCDRHGEWVIVDFQNDHWPDFKSMELNSGDDCDRLVIKRLQRLLGIASS